MIYGIRFYIYDLFLYIQLLLEKKEKHELGYYNKIVNNITNSNGVKINHDLIAQIKSRNAENISDNIVANNNINLFQIRALQEEKERLQKERKTLLFNKKCSKNTLDVNKAKLKELNNIMQILNITL